MYAVCIGRIIGVGSCRNKMIGIWTKRSHLDRFRRMVCSLEKATIYRQRGCSFLKLFNSRCDKEFSQ